MNLSDFDYDLPQHLIAQHALPKRSDARLMVLDRKRQTIAHRHFRDITDYFGAGDLLVLNDTKVIPARLFAKRETGAHVEILVLKPGDREHEAFALVKPSARVQRGDRLMVSGDEQTKLLVCDEPNKKDGVRRLQTENGEAFGAFLKRAGHIPLPPYIDREDSAVDRELYQTVFAKSPGAVASPTAGLHFDAALLDQLEAKGVELLYVTLHVSYGTFQPVQTENLSEHRMHEEMFEIFPETAERIEFAKTDGRSIAACGTTVVRTLEAAAKETVPPEVEARRDSTRLFIYPPYEFKIQDRLITNFHLPKSTLLMLTAAFAGHDFLMEAYQEAIREKYRFYSYGDAMLIL